MVHEFPKLFFIIYLSLGLCLHPTIISAFSKNMKKEESVILPPCKVCKIFTDSFAKGLKDTERGKFEGGDTAWEEAKLRSYATSEIRLTEIQENVCSDVKEGKDQCYALHEQFDSEIEDWWLNKRQQEPDLYKYFCIDLIKRCCPPYHFGPNCTPCKGYPNNICSGNGRCMGAGTRKGNGQCVCKEGYTGVACNECTANYYEASQSVNKVICLRCHRSCTENCTVEGSAGCLECKSGWIMEKGEGCVDINECVLLETPCEQNQFCVNTEGSYICSNCNRACVGCTGNGPDKCIKCAPGYILIDNTCVDARMVEHKYLSLTRYLTYLGLCICTYIIFNRSAIIASILGTSVAIYIAASEYFLLHEQPKN